MAALHREVRVPPRRRTPDTGEQTSEGRYRSPAQGNKGEQMKMQGYVCPLLVMGTMLTTPGLAAQGPTPKSGAGTAVTKGGPVAHGPTLKPGGAAVATKGKPVSRGPSPENGAPTTVSGKAGRQQPGSGKGSASINGTGGRGSSSSVNGTGMGVRH